MPQAEAVNRRQAEPDDEKRDSLPGRDQSHGDEVQPDEERPGDVHPVRANEVAGPVTPLPCPAPRTTGRAPRPQWLSRHFPLFPPPLPRLPQPTALEGVFWKPSRPPARGYSSVGVAPQGVCRP